MSTPLTLRAETEIAVRAFRDGLAAGLATVACPQPLAPHIGAYREERSGNVFSRLLRGPHVTVKLTTADYVWNGRASFWISVGLDANGVSVVSVSVDGFGIMEGHIGEGSTSASPVRDVAERLGLRAAQIVIEEHYSPRLGWGY